MSNTSNVTIVTDGDGLTNYEEILLTITIHLVYNLVSKQLSDANVDLDSYGFSDIEEIKLGTNSAAADSDALDYPITMSYAPSILVHMACLMLKMLLSRVYLLRQTVINILKTR